MNTMVERLLSLAEDLQSQDVRSAVFRRRAVSTAYYAVFHALARLCADELIGKNGRSSRDYERVYRALDHGPLKSAFERSPLKDDRRLCRRSSKRATQGGLHASKARFAAARRMPGADGGGQERRRTAERPGAGRTPNLVRASAVQEPYAVKSLSKARRSTRQHVARPEGAGLPAMNKKLRKLDQ